ncbi:MAG TPA: rhodanese-like domain-containing protein, partial [Anaerolineaceae bacterium]|nr:rhodanese-like domain-containing protein [Anaerolineaceae bacterium]
CLLRMFGHRKVAVLAGDFNIWQKEGRPVAAGVEERTQTEFQGDFDPSVVVDANELQRLLDRGETLLIDARAPERFRGEQEPLDAVAGHIPGAVNRFHGENLKPDGNVKSPGQLREEFDTLLDGAHPEAAVVYCGSGVTSCFHLVAMEHAGLTGARLYAGSWSEWIRDPNRPVATGE